MKYKLLSLAAVAALFCLALVVTNLDGGMLPRTVEHELAQTADGTQTSGTLPVVCIDTADGAMPELFHLPDEVGQSSNEYGSSSVSATVTVYAGDGDGGYDATAPLSQNNALVRYRGHSSLLFDKKQYKLCFVDENGVEDKTVPFLGMEPFDEWALNAPYLDRSLMRNYLCFNVAGQVMPYTPDVRYCEVYVNGEYQGLYLGMETIAKGEGRVDLQTYKEGSKSLSYLVREDWVSVTNTTLNDLANYGLLYYPSSDMSVIYPGADKLTPDYAQQIARDLSAFEKALYSYDYDDPELGYRQYIDTGSFVDYFILNEFFQNIDAGRYSTYFYKDAKGKLCAGPVWDFNSALGYYTDADLSAEGFVLPGKAFFTMLIKDEAFVERVIARYRQLRKTVLSEEYLTQFVDDTQTYLGAAVERNNALWGSRMYGENMQPEIILHPQERNPENYGNALGQLKTFIHQRGVYLDTYIETLRQYCHESAVKTYNP